MQTSRDGEGGRGGFTLLEMLAALTVGGAVMVLVSTILTTVITSAAAIDRGGSSHEEAMNGRRWLNSVLRSAMPPTDSMPFVGQSSELVFSSAVRTADGWYESRRIRVRVVDDRLIAEVNGQQSVPLGDGAAVEFDYLLEPGAVSRWVREWVSGLTTPVAARMRVSQPLGGSQGVDTTLFAIREWR